MTKIRIRGFKSIRQEQEMDIRPLTILAGANSSGKSSMIQPLLLLKQTLEVPYDPGALWLNGPNVKFTSTKQFLPRPGNGDTVFSIGLTVIGDPRLPRPSVSPTDLTIVLSQEARGKKLDVKQMIYERDDQRIALHTGMSPDEIEALIPSKRKEELEAFFPPAKLGRELAIIRNRCFLDVGYEGTNMSASHFIFDRRVSPSLIFGPFIQEIIHLPGLRGNPERSYPVAAVGSMFPGTFETYAASVIAQWQEKKSDDKLKALGENLKQLGLTWKVQARSVDETQVELLVGRLPRAAYRGARDLVNIADVGFGVSQMLPVLVALLEAKPGQLVYLEQPEIHLHPRAQTALARILAAAALRGVRVVIETHSSLLLLGIQTLVAEGTGPDHLPPEMVKLHWFTRDEDGVTRITSADLDATGAFGDWPEDFADVELDAQGRYLDAAAAHE
ncbi:MAG: AAA family ATPase [Chloroflexaceae bacterium]|nr:AAA family ATPase [Chloroflexaceae bacterium]